MCVCKYQNIKFIGLKLFYKSKETNFNFIIYKLRFFFLYVLCLFISVKEGEIAE